MSQPSRRAALKLGAAATLGAAGSSFLWPADVVAAEPAVAPKPAPATALPKVKNITDYSDAVLVEGEPAKLAPGAFSIVVLPDTQKYAKDDPAGFLAQTEWIARNREARNIACVLHLGDITDNNRPDQWDLAVRAMTRLDGVVPYFMALGNHDYSAEGFCTDRTTRYNEYFPLAKHRQLSTFGGVYDREPNGFENSYHLFSAGGRDFLVLALEFGPRADVVRWANEVAARHRQRAILLVTHAYMYFDETRYDWSTRGKQQSWNPHDYKVAANTNNDVTDGEELWQQLVSRHENFLLTLNGHVLGDGLARKVTATPGGRAIPQMLVNFQLKPKGGDGWLRVLEFQADGRTIDVCDYSPTRNQCNASPQNKFQIQTAPVKV